MQWSWGNLRVGGGGQGVAPNVEINTSCMTVIALGQNVKAYPTFQCKLLLILKIGVPIFIGASLMQCTKLC